MDDIENINLGETKLHVMSQLPNKSELLSLTSNCNHTLLIIDDSLELGSNIFFTELFCLHTHHQKMTAIIATQDIHAGKHWPTIFKNAHTWAIMGGTHNMSALMKIGRIMGNYK